MHSHDSEPLFLSLTYNGGALPMKSLPTLKELHPRSMEST